MLWQELLCKVEANMKYFATVILLFIFIAQSGCVKLTSSEVGVKSPPARDKGPKVVSFMNNTPFTDEMRAALSDQGFVVKPMPSPQKIMELQDQSRSAPDYIGHCARTEFSIYNFTLMLIDMTNNQIVMVLMQDGSDGPCMDIEPVFGTLAESLSHNW